ncbi:4Fe-4S binding protein [Rhodococcus antarcticus]|uniref:4Fe-4S binding protein n=1 Tax=Rhodococcus antarcticus TaxID=2987751 RepID=A0ABY6P2M1_9NOCA|nr:4Fe-4S binding protein [Rhodococcus antarcticus]UZJ25759.1 4Fe-4S binding protein [Rhodococcus antarcticus]
MLSELVVTDVSDECTACGACLLTCPEHALRPAPGRPLVLADACTGCGECVEICPRDALTVGARLAP